MPGGRAEPDEMDELTVVREVREETGEDTWGTCKIGEYHEEGVQDGLEYDYYASCFLINPIGGKIRRQENEVDEVGLFNVENLPKIMAFLHSRMIRII